MSHAAVKRSSVANARIEPRTASWVASSELDRTLYARQAEVRSMVRQARAAMESLPSWVFSPREAQ